MAIIKKLAPCIFILNCWIVFAGISQNLDSTRITEWNIVNANNIDKINNPNDINPLSPSSNIYNIVEWFGADNTGRTDVSQILQEALDATPADAIIYFPTGVYLFRKGISVPSHKIIRGTSPLLTAFKFDLISSEKNPFIIIGKPSMQYYTVSKVFPIGSNKIVVEGASRHFQAGDDIELERKNIPREMYTVPRWKEFATEWMVGQMLSISKVVGDTIYFDRSLTLNYNRKFEVRIQKVEMAEEVGLEGFLLERIDKNIPGSNFNFIYTKNSWISCVKSHKATNTHVSLSGSRDCHIKGSYFDDAYFHCAGGMGYGVAVRGHSSENHIYNNIFTNLRHSMLVSRGANRNVFSYNYSTRTKISQGNAMINGYCDEYMLHESVDISIHGYYSFMNLFEHNVVQRIVSADYWGPTGPGTTFFRNMIEAETDFLILDSSIDHNVIGNVITGDFRTDSSVKGTLRMKNNIANEIDTLPQVKLPPSLYLDAKPKFYGELHWPSIDPDSYLKYNTNPAKERWKNHKLFDELCCGSNILIPDSRVFVNNSFYAFIQDNMLYIHGNYYESFNVSIYTIDGKLLQETLNVNVEQGIPFTANKTANLNMLVLHLYNNEMATSIKIVNAL